MPVPFHGIYKLELSKVKMLIQNKNVIYLPMLTRFQILLELITKLFFPKEIGAFALMIYNCVTYKETLDL